MPVQWTVSGERLQVAGCRVTIAVLVLEVHVYRYKLMASG